MQTTFTSQPGGKRWLGWSILLIALILLCLALASIVSSFFNPRTSTSFDLIDGILFLPLLGYVAVGITLLKTSRVSILHHVYRSSLVGLALGILLGVAIMLPGRDLNACPGLLVILLAFVAPGDLATWITGTDSWGQFSLQAAVGIPLLLICFLVYGGVSWWSVRHSVRLITGIGDALLAAFLAPLTIMMVASLIHYLPLLWSPHQMAFMCFFGEGEGASIFAYYFGFLLTMLFPLGSQLLLAVIAGLIGGFLTVLEIPARRE